MPIFGITASSNQSVKLTDFYQIATTTLGSAQTSIEFTGIPSTYTHLQLRFIARTPTTSDNIVMQFNSDTGTNYSTHYLSGNGSSASSGALSSSSWMYLDVLTASSTSYSACVVDILDYANTNKFKTIRSLAGIDLNGSGTAFFASGNWRNTNAITSIKLQTSVPRDISQYSSFQLYGVKA